jgi:hypothetical protein
VLVLTRSNNHLKTNHYGYQKESVHLYRNKKSKRTGMVPIYLRITINSKSDELSSGRKRLECAWDNETKKVIGDKPETNEINDRISQIQADLKRHFIVLDAMYTIVTPEMLRNVYHGLPAMTEKELKGKKKEMNLLEAADRHISFVEEMVERNKLAVGT